MNGNILCRMVGNERVYFYNLKNFQKQIQNFFRYTFTKRGY